MDPNRNIFSVDDSLNIILTLNPEMKNVEELPDNIQKAINHILEKHEIEEITNEIISAIDQNKLSLLLYIFKQFYRSDVLPPENERVHNALECYRYNQHIIKKAKLACKILMNRNDLDSLSRECLLNCIGNYLSSAEQNDDWSYYDPHDRYHVEYEDITQGDVYESDGDNYTEEFTELDLSIIENPNIPFEYKEQIYELAKQAKDNDEHAWEEILDMFVTHPVVYSVEEYITLQSLKSQLIELNTKCYNNLQNIVNLSKSRSKFKWFFAIIVFFCWCLVVYYKKRTEVIERKIYDIKRKHNFGTILSIPEDKRFPRKRYNLSNLNELRNKAQGLNKEITDLKTELASITGEYEKTKPKFNWKWLTLIGTIIYCVKLIRLAICYYKNKKYLLSQILTLESNPIIQTLKHAEEARSKDSAYGDHKKYVLSMQKIIDAYEKQKNPVDNNREARENKNTERPKQNIIFNIHGLA